MQPAAGVIELTAAEIDLLVRLCRKYRSSIPIYLQCVREELHLVDDALQKLLQAAS